MGSGDEFGGGFCPNGESKSRYPIFLIPNSKFFIRVEIFNLAKIE